MLYEYQRRGMIEDAVKQAEKDTRKLKIAEQAYYKAIDEEKVLAEEGNRDLSIVPMMRPVLQTLMEQAKRSQTLAASFLQHEMNFIDKDIQIEGGIPSNKHLNAKDRLLKLSTRLNTTMSFKKSIRRKPAHKSAKKPGKNPVNKPGKKPAKSVKNRVKNRVKTW